MQSEHRGPPPRRQRRGVGGRPSTSADDGPKGTVKKRLRGLERLLQRGNLPDDVRRAKEAELASLQGEAQKQKKVQRERHFSKKYHGVKFVERRKVERLCILEEL